MKNSLIDYLVQQLQVMPSEIIVMLISCFPVIELRGALPIAVTFYQMAFWKGYFFSVVGNMLPVIPLLLLFRPLSEALMRFQWYKWMYDWLYKRTMRKSKNVERYGALGLILFTAVPLPTTGAWTACIAASLLRIRFTYAFGAIFAGVLIAGLIMGGFAYSIFG